MHRNNKMKYVKSFRRKPLRVLYQASVGEIKIHDKSNKVKNKILLVIWMILFPPLILVLWRKLLE